MISIKINGEAIDLPEDFSMEINESSPIYNDVGSQSMPCTAPATRKNMRVLGAPHRLDIDINPNNPERKAEVQVGAYMRRGVLNVTEASRGGYTFNVGFDNSAAYAYWQQKKLSELADLPIIVPRPREEGFPVDWLLDDLYQIYVGDDPQWHDFAIFPVAINNEDKGEDNLGRKDIYWEVLNIPDKNSFTQPRTVSRLIDGVVTTVTIPEGYCVSPFLRVWRVIELIFSDMGLTLISNPFKDELELSRLVVLNNAADSVCLGRIKYADLLPDCSVSDFLNALWVRFGLIYNIDYNSMTADLRLMRDIIKSRNVRKIDGWMSAPEKVIYDTQQYVKLSAKTSIEGAKPSHERFEDFTKGLDVSKVRMGLHVSEWQNVGSANNPVWDGDDNYYEWEDYDDGRDDDRDDFDFFAQSRSKSDDASSDDSFLAREFVTGQWFRLDATNGEVRSSSSSFFNWDPQSDGSPLELSSVDECVPIGRVNNVGKATGNIFNDKAPCYLVGARHYHSFIAGSEDAANSGDETPLAFMFAYPVGGKTIGRLNGEGDDGMPIGLDDGSNPQYSLYFQFKDGLFSKFWADYDEILRHGNRTVEADGVVNKIELNRLDLLNVYTLRNIRCLIDTASYSLPSGKNVPVRLTLRTIMTQGRYDIRKEQNIPDFSASARHLVWALKSDGFSSGIDSDEARDRAAAIYIDQSGYEQHGEPGDYWYVGGNGAVLVNSVRLSPLWQTDPDKPEAVRAGQIIYRNYPARLTYDIFEIHDMTMGPGDDDWELEEISLGRVSVDVTYEVQLISRWAAD